MPENSSETPPAVAAASSDVQDAIENVSEAATDAPNKAMEELLTSVKGVLEGVTAQLKRANDLAEKAVTPAEPTPAPEPEVEVEVPKPQERKIRRNGRKITRRG